MKSKSLLQTHYAKTSSGRASVRRAAALLLSLLAMRCLSPTGQAAGRVVAWGDNGLGQTNVPPGLTDVTAIAAGGSHNLALRSNGTVVEWGSLSFGDRTMPAGLSNVAAIAASYTHSLVLKADGTLDSWGTIISIPADLTNVVAIAAGNFLTVALRSDGTVVSLSSDVSYTTGLTNIARIGAGDSHVLAVRSNGTVAAWGFSAAATNVPTGLSNVVAVAGGAEHSLALLSDGTVRQWGNNLASLPSDLTNAVAIAARGFHNLALKSDGSIGAWGGPLSRTNNPLQYLAPIAISAGILHDLALLRDSMPIFPPSSPVGLTVFGGTNLALSSGPAFGLPIPSYQWLHDGTAIPGATNTTLVLSNIVPADAGSYWVMATNVVGSVSSQMASLTVLTNIVLQYQPQSRAQPAGTAVSFLVGAGGAGPFRYQWRHSGSELAGATNALLVLPAVSNANAGVYDVKVSNPFGIVTLSDAASLTVFANTNKTVGYLLLDFDGPLLGGINPYGVASIGAGGLSGGGVLRLMTNVNSAFSDFVIDDFSGDAEVTAFKASFDLLLGGGTFIPGDGFSFNFATNFYLPPNYYGPPPREEGFTNGLSGSFDTWDNVNEFATWYGMSDTAPAVETKTFAVQTGFQSMSGIRGAANGTTNGLPAGPLLTNAATGRPLSLETEPPYAIQNPLTNYVPVTIELKLDGTVWVTYGGSLVLSNVQTFMPAVTGGKFALAARTGGATENVWIDNLTIQTFSGARPAVFATADPVNQRLDVGWPATFQAQLFGALPITLQWYSNDVAIVGATNAMHTTPPATLANHGDVYRIEARNGINATDRSAALLLQAVVFVSDGPESAVVRASQTATFGAVLAGSLPIRLQWFSNDVAIAGATNATYTTPPTTIANLGDTYRIDASNAVGVVSRSATLMFAIPPTIVESPQARTVIAGDDVTFAVTVTNIATLPIGYQWRKSSPALTITNIVLHSRTSSFTLFDVSTNITQSSGPGSYRVVVTNVANVQPGVASPLVTLTVLPATPPMATTLDPSNVAANNATLNASVHPKGAQSVAWFDYGLTLAYGQRTPAVRVGNASNLGAFSEGVTGLLASTNYHYRVVVTNHGGMALGPDMVFQTTTALSPIIISGYELLGNGQFRLRFDAAPGSNFSVLVSTNLADWTALGAATELTPGHFEFTDVDAPGHPTRFYRLRTP